MADAPWRPGSFTKNFSWGADKGLKELYDIIKAGFANEVTDVPRKLFRERVALTGRPDYIPLNFFLLNGSKNGVDHILVDELVYQALSFDHSSDFDRLALLVFNFSLVGSWRGASRDQNRPALWAHHYISDRVSRVFNWDASFVTADDIDLFVSNNPNYKAKTSRKLSTNLNFLYKIGKLSSFRSSKAESWWIAGLYSAADRVSSRLGASSNLSESRLDVQLTAHGFREISGRRSIEKDLATRHFLTLYAACGGRARFDEKPVHELQTSTLPGMNELPEGSGPIGVFHRSNVRARGVIPQSCRLLARYRAEFETYELGELSDNDLASYIESRTSRALEELKQKKIAPVRPLEEITKLTREA